MATPPTRSRNKSLERVEKELKCSVCLNRLRDPRVFPVCQHSFCYECIVELIESNQGKSKIPCPDCRAEAEVGNPPDLSQFKPMNHRVSNILENLEQLHDIPGKRTICEMHEGEELKYYCRTCEKPTCKHCKLQDHHKHECCPIDVISNEIKKSLLRKLVTLREQKAELSYDISNFEKLKEVITEKNEQVHGDIKRHFESLAEIMELQKQQLLDRADLLTNYKLEIIEKKLGNHRQTRDSVEKNIGDLEMTDRSKDYEKVLYTEKCVSMNIENIPFANEQLSVDDDMKFLVSASSLTEDFKASLAKSHFVANYNVRPEYCTTSLEPKHPKVGEKAVITVTCKDKNNCDIKHGGQIIKAEFTGCAAVAVHDEVDRNDGTHVFEFVPATQGKLTVKFCINGQEAPNCMLKAIVHPDPNFFTDVTIKTIPKYDMY